MVLMSLFNMSEKAYLMLANGQVFEGRSFGAKGTVIGEVVFTTGLTGYQETLTDPSYFGQIVTQTFPLIGNYGVNSEDSESAKSYVSGYIVREWCNAPSNFRCEGNINDFSSIRFMRMFMTNFEKPIVLRFGTLELVRGEWRNYDYSLQGRANHCNIKCCRNLQQ